MSDVKLETGARVPAELLAIAQILIPGGVGIGQELASLRKFESGIAS
jgi:hypothetical protein